MQQAGETAIDMAKEIAKKSGTSLVESTSNSIRKKWQGIDCFGSQKKYKENLFQIVSTTKILGNPKSISIENIYTDCYVFDRLSALRRFNGDLCEVEKDGFGALPQLERFSALDIVKTGDDLFILGKPGAGKTTFLKYLSILACKGEIKKTPIFVSLKDWSDSSLSIIPFIAEQFDKCGFPDAEPFVRALLKRGDALILLDGLDEVNEADDRRSQTIREVVNLSNKYRGCQYCLTCRTAATDYSFERFKYLEVADFTESQQLLFVEQWYGAKSKLLENFLNGWSDKQQDGLRELGRTPLLLTLMCLAFEETLTFPVRQVDIYKDAIDALLRKWDTSRLIGRDTFYKNLSYSRREHLLEAIAAKFYFESRIVFHRSEVEREISRYLQQLPDREKSTDTDSSLVLRQIEAQHGLIVERAVNVFSFSHLTLQEYFTASFLVKSHDEKMLDRLVAVGLQDQKWKEVILYTVGLLPSADPILTRMATELLNMRGSQPGVIRFLAFCNAEAMIRIRMRGGALVTIDGFSPIEIKDKIKHRVKVDKLPSLTMAEISKISEHVSKIHAFVVARKEKYDFGIAADMINVAYELISERPGQSAELMGGYFFRPEEFISYLYACRLMIECLEVSVSNQRNGYLTSVMSLSNKDILNVIK